MASTEELYQHFVARTKGNSRAQRELRRLLSSSEKLPEQQSPSPLLPIDEAELKLQCIRQIEDYWREDFTLLTQRPRSEYRPLNDIEVSGLFLMDLRTLQFCMGDYTIIRGFLASAHALPSVLKICMLSSRY